METVKCSSLHLNLKRVPTAAKCGLKERMLIGCDVTSTSQYWIGQERERREENIHKTQTDDAET